MPGYPVCFPGDVLRNGKKSRIIAILDTWEKSVMIKNVILDMGNVLLSYNPGIPLDVFCKTDEEKQTIRRELFEGPEWVQGDLGYMTCAEKYESVKARVPLSMHPSLKRCAYEWRICMQPIAGALAFCAYIKESGRRIYVLSNASDEFYEYFPKFAPLDYFDGVVVSCDLHMVKPNAGIYRHLLKTYRLNPEECLFLDDMEENVIGAKQEGIQGEVFSGDFEAVKRKYRL